MSVLGCTITLAEIVVSVNLFKPHQRHNNSTYNIKWVTVLNKEVRSQFGLKLIVVLITNKLSIKDIFSRIHKIDIFSRIL